MQSFWEMYWQMTSDRNCTDKWPQMGQEYSTYSEEGQCKDATASQNFKFLSHLGWPKNYIHSLYKKVSWTILHSLAQWSNWRKCPRLGKSSEICLEANLEGVLQVIWKCTQYLGDRTFERKKRKLMSRFCLKMPKNSKDEGSFFQQQEGSSNGNKIWRVFWTKPCKNRKTEKISDNLHAEITQWQLKCFTLVYSVYYHFFVLASTFVLLKLYHCH